MHDALFKNFRKLSRENILALAKESAWTWTSSRPISIRPNIRSLIKKDLADGETAGVYGTPSFFVNGKHYNGPMSLDAIKPILDAELKGTKPQVTAVR